MALVLLRAHHHDVDLRDVERLSVGAGAVPGELQDPSGAVRGVVVLATCNRLEVYLDADDVPAAVGAARQVVARTSGVGETEVDRLMTRLGEDDAVQHLFAVAAGLDSMVVGEREITGQVRRALQAARSAGTVSPLLERLFQHAARTAREVALATDLARAGRSVVSVALDLGAAHAEHCRRAVAPPPAAPETELVPPARLSATRALLIGTGSYAGASLAALRERGCEQVQVWSASGRAQAFAERHGVVELPEGDLLQGLVGVDLVVTCRGTGATVLDADLVGEAVRRRGASAEPLVVVDLALHRDVAPEVAELDGVVLVDLATVRQHTPAVTAVQIAHAQELVDAGVRRFGDDLAARAMDHAVVALRKRVEAMVDEELEKLPAGAVLPAEEAERALRRLAARLTHIPTVRARDAGRAGRAADHLHALEQTLGLAVTDRSAPRGEPVRSRPAPPAEQATDGSDQSPDPATPSPASEPADLRGTR